MVLNSYKLSILYMEAGKMKRNDLLFLCYYIVAVRRPLLLQSHLLQPLCRFRSDLIDQQVSAVGMAGADLFTCL